MACSIHAKFGVLSSQTTCNKSDISDQIESLKSALLEHAESNTTLQQTCQSNGYLSNQLNVERAKCLKLEETIRSHRQNETDLHSLSSRLETQLSDFRNQVQDLEFAQSELQQELVESRDQLRTVEIDRCSAATKLQEAEQIRQKEESRANELEVRPFPITHLHSDRDRKCPMQPRQRLLSWSKI